MSKAEQKRIQSALEALSGVKTPSEYQAAKRLAKRCEPANQLALIDSLIAARSRSMGVS